MSDKKMVLEQFCDLYLSEIKKLIKKGELTPAECDTGHKALEAMWLIDNMLDMEEMKEYSQGEGYWMYGMYPHSEKRGRNKMGQYTSREPMDMTTSRAIDKCIDILERNR